MRPTLLLMLLGLLAGAVFLAGCTAPQTAGPPVTPVATAPSATAPDDLVFLTEDYPPLNYVENGTIRGVSVDLLRGVLRKMGSSVASDRITVLSWSQAYETALSRNNTVVFATVRLPEREHLFKWAGPLGSDRKVLFSMKDISPVITTPADLDRYRIGVVRNDSAHLQLLGLGVNASRIIAYPTVRSLISAMQDGTIDLWCYGETVGRYHAGKVTGDPNMFSVVYALEYQDHYYAFNRNTPDEFVAAFQAALDSLRYEPDETGITEYQRIMHRYFGVSCTAEPPVSRELVVSLVDYTADALMQDAPGTIARVNAGEHPFWDRENRALYVFVYDTNVTIVAEADNPRLIGVNMKGKTDVAGTPFREQIVERALTEGTGWVDYIWMIPDRNGIYYKSAYFRLVKGSDSQSYIVASGMYIPCDA
ncbi:MAG TPA: transporter substrate-binding domain-containing protein [Methanolinea sp.]|nr:transporter substrate-binding domain-containing protein [Methanolinea sp.]